ncbi:MAG: hypothetical protein LBL96_05830 [Clostridiales bacterium]|nr:hypothetical protein [Clostridiales bacterium]
MLLQPKGRIKQKLIKCTMAFVIAGAILGSFDTVLAAAVPTNPIGENLIVNGSFEEGKPSGVGISFFASYPGWVLPEHYLEIHRLPYLVGSDTQFNSAAAGNASAELNADLGKRTIIYQDFATLPGSTLEVKFAISCRISSKGVSDLTVKMGPTNGQASSSAFKKDTAPGTWEYVSFTYIVPENQTTTRIEFSSNNYQNSSLGNEIDDISVKTIAMPATPTSTPTPTATYSPIPTATSTPTPTATSVPDPTATSTPIHPATSTPTPTSTPVIIAPIYTSSPTPTSYNQYEPSFTPEPTPTEKPPRAYVTLKPMDASSSAATPTPTDTSASAAVNVTSATNTPTPTNTPQPTNTPAEVNAGSGTKGNPSTSNSDSILGLMIIVVFVASSFIYISFRHRKYEV